MLRVGNLPVHHGRASTCRQCVCALVTQCPTPWCCPTLILKLGLMRKCGATQRNEADESLCSPENTLLQRASTILTLTGVCLPVVPERQSGHSLEVIKSSGDTAFRTGIGTNHCMNQTCTDSWSLVLFTLCLRFLSAREMGKQPGPSQVRGWTASLGHAAIPDVMTSYWAQSQEAECLVTAPAGAPWVWAACTPIPPPPPLRLFTCKSKGMAAQGILTSWGRGLKHLF